MLAADADRLGYILGTRAPDPLACSPWLASRRIDEIPMRRPSVRVCADHLVGWLSSLKADEAHDALAAFLRVRMVEAETRRQRLRDAPLRAMPPSPPPVEQPPGIFISHAGEDKDAIARPLADALSRRGHRVWFDEQSMVLGDSLRQRIEEGVGQASIAVVILSQASSVKPWPQRELNCLFTRFVEGGLTALIPIWHGITAEDVRRMFPLMADLVAASSQESIEQLVTRIEEALVRRAA